MGKKSLAVAALALIAILVAMWQQTQTSEATPARTANAPAVAAAPLISTSAPAVREVAAVAAPVVPAQPAASAEKYDPQSDEFFFKHDEMVVPQVMKSVVKCWEALDPAKRATIHRNQSIVIKFKQKIVNGTVTISGAEVERSSLKDAALEACFSKQVLATTWHDDKLPDWEQDDEVKISPRVLKKYTRENIEYVGAEAPKAGTYLTREQMRADFDPSYKE
ncbi:MAG TPA: hypothetical protein VK427_05360 [Kofleriaceae bacterium]|nr:hypothetical protein [Kofleriaceae bacterium]